MANESRFTLIDKSTHPTGALANGASLANRRANKGPSYDLLGAVIRRKGILLFSLAVAGILGYLYFLRQPKVFASSMKLMIWTQAPPRLVDREGTTQPISSTGKHVTLMLSEAVLAKAVADGEIRSLPTFAGVADPVGPLRSMISVSPAKDAADTLVLSASGPRPEDLPTVLKDLVAAYQEILSEDSAAITKSSAELIEKLQERIADEKNTSEERYLELVQELGVSPDPESGKYSNPYTSNLEHLRQLRSDKERSLREVTERIQNVKEILANRTEDRDELMRLVAIEASQEISVASKVEGAVAIPTELDEYRQKLSRLSLKIEALEGKLYENRLQLRNVKKVVGDRHPSANRLNTETESLAAELNDLLNQRRALQQKDDALQAKPRGGAETSLTKVSSLESELINIYLASLERRAQQFSSSIEGYDKEIKSAEEQATKIGGEIEELNVLSGQIKEKESAIRQIVDQLSSLTLVASNYTSTKVRVIDSPGFGYQVAPKLTNTLIMFLFSGAMIAMGIIALLDWSDLSFRNPNEIREKLGLPVVARIAKMEGAGKIKDGHTECLITLERPKSAVAEAYRACRTAMLFIARQQNMKVFLITSPSAGDGKSTTAVNLAMCFAQGGLKTVIIDADLRRPRCHVYLGVPIGPGLKDFAIGEKTSVDIVRQSALHPNLSVITAGKHFSNPSEFLDSAQFESLLTELRQKYDIVLVDSPPVLPVADAMTLSSVCDGALLVMKIRKGVVLSSEKAVETLRTVNANLLGVIVNQVEKLSHYSDYGKYGYNGYGGYAYYAGRYYDRQNEKYYEPDAKSETPNSN